jgi:CRP-like cAMP-binding protein
MKWRARREAYARRVAMSTADPFHSAAVADADDAYREQRAHGKGGELGPVWMGVLREVPLFAALSDRHLRRLARHATAASFRQGEFIASRGAPGDAFDVVLDGEVEVRLEDGESIRLGPGGFFGEVSLIDGKPRGAAVRATTAVTTMRLARGPFLEALQDEPTIAIALLEELAARLRQSHGVAAHD